MTEPRYQHWCVDRDDGSQQHCVFDTKTGKIVIELGDMEEVTKRLVAAMNEANEED